MLLKIGQSDALRVRSSRGLTLVQEELAAPPPPVSSPDSSPLPLVFIVGVEFEFHHLRSSVDRHVLASPPPRPPALSRRVQGSGRQGCVLWTRGVLFAEDHMGGL